MQEIDKLDVTAFFKMSTDSRSKGHNFKIVKQQNRTKQRVNVSSQRVIEPRSEKTGLQGFRPGPT